MADTTRLELIDGTSAKFWQVTVEGTTVTTNWGKIGTDGQTKVAEEATEDAARASAAKQIEAKTKKGYAAVDEPTTVPPKTDPKAAAPKAEKKAPATKAPEKKAPEKKAPETSAGNEPVESAGDGDTVRLEYHDDKSSKFWQVTVEGSTVTTNWGKVGTKGQTKVAEEESPEAARLSAATQRAAKEKKGYAIADPSDQEDD